MKKKLMAILLGVTLLASSSTVLADNDSVIFNDTNLPEANTVATSDLYASDIYVSLDGKWLTFDVAPIIKDGRTLVPFRAIFEALKCDVEYEVIDGGQYITAVYGDDTIKLKIGQQDMAVNGKTMGLDVAPIIQNNRTLVPLRAVSQALGADVEWIDETRTVVIRTHGEINGQYQVNTSSSEIVLMTEENIPYMNINISYPYIENDDNNVYINEINTYFKEKATEFHEGMIEEFAEDAKEQIQYMGEDFQPMEFESYYNVEFNGNDILSIATNYYCNTNGAHPYSYTEAKTYDIAKKRELPLTEILGCTQNEVDKLVEDKFTALLKELYEVLELSTEEAESLREMRSKVSYYINEDGLILYYNPYDIAPYAFGAPSIMITKDSGLLKINSRI